MNISITIYIINLEFSVSILNVLLEGSESLSTSGRSHHEVKHVTMKKKKTLRKNKPLLRVIFKRIKQLYSLGIQISSGINSIAAIRAFF